MVAVMMLESSSLRSASVFEPSLLLFQAASFHLEFPHFVSIGAFSFYF